LIDHKKRKEFIVYLNKLIKGHYNNSDWLIYIIEHYLDEELEEVRRNIVRLRIAAGDPEFFPVTNEHKEKLKDWIRELQIILQNLKTAIKYNEYNKKQRIICGSAETYSGRRQFSGAGV
jgi:hypothetical protein